MIVTPADRQLAATFVATFADPNAGVVLCDPNTPDPVYSPASADQEWEFAFLLIAVARRAGWAPPPDTKPVTPGPDQG